MPDQWTRLRDRVAIVAGAGATGSGDFVGIGLWAKLHLERQEVYPHFIRC